MRLLFIIYMVFMLASCSSKDNIKDTDYEKKIKHISYVSECPYQNVYYYPELRCDYYLDIDNLEKASGYYKVKNPTDVLMFELTTSDNIKVYLNDLNEYIVVVE